MALNRFGSTLAEIEREHILDTLTCCDGNRTRAAKFLNISLRCLRMKLHQFGQSGSPVAAGGQVRNIVCVQLDNKGPAERGLCVAAVSNAAVNCVLP